MARYTFRAAFTLVELSVVLVIIGLLVAGVLAGREMIRAAAVNQLIRDLQSYEAAIRLFKGKYDQFPGDMTNATSFWPSSGNGDGDRNMGHHVSHSSYSLEEDGFRAWQHLALAGYIQGSFTGVTGSGGDGDAIIGENVPPGPFGSGLTITTMVNFLGDSHWFPIDGNFIMVGRDSGAYYTLLGFLTPEEAWKIDKKLDGDLSPASGKVRTNKGGGSYAPGCTTTDNPSTAQYDLDNASGLCNIIFMLDN